MKDKFKVLFLFILIFNLVDVPSPGSAQSLPFVRVQPAIVEVNSEEAFTLSVIIENVVNLYGFDINLEFDPNLIDVTGVEMGDFLEQGLYFNVIDNYTGNIQIVNSQQDPSESKSGSGILVLIHFTALTEAGTSSISLVEPDTVVVLTDRNGFDIECDLVGGFVEVFGSGEKENYSIYVPLILT